MQDPTGDLETGSSPPRCPKCYGKESLFPVRHTVPRREHPVGGNEAARAPNLISLINDLRYEGKLVGGSALSPDNVRGAIRVAWALLRSKTGGNQGTQYDVFHG